MRNDNIRVKHFERPVKCLVVSYVPASLGRDHDITNGIPGAFQLAPGINPVQLKFLIKLCRVRQEFVNMS